MNLSEICIKRPVLAWVMTLVIILLGLTSFYKLPVQYYPNIEAAAVTVETQLPGASAEVVENSLTRPLEERMASIDGIYNITSNSQVEKSSITITANKTKKLSDLKFDVLEAINAVARDLPSDAQKPLLKSGGGVGSQSLVIYLVLKGKDFELGELAEFARNEIQNNLETIEGVSQVFVQGSGEYKMHVYLDPIKLSSHSFTAEQVRNAIVRHNFEMPAGYIRTGDRQYIVTTVSNLEKPIQFENIAIGERNGHVIRISDVGRAEMIPEEKTTRSRFNGEQVIAITVNKQTTANPIAISDAVKKQLPVLRSKLRDGMQLDIGVDRAQPIRISIHEVYKTIIEAILFVGLVVFVFLRSLRASVIPLITIPISLIGAFFVMSVFGFTINMMTLTAMVLAIGLVVDDAIVVLENIHRYIERGLTPMEASIKGIKEISFSIIAMTLTLAAVYAPISLVSSEIGKWLIEFSVTLASAVIISGFAALTLSPMMCSRLLQSHKEEAKSMEWINQRFPVEAWLEKLDILYGRALDYILNKRFYLIGSIIVLGFLTYGLSRFIPGTLLPKEDQGSIYVQGYGPETATIDYVDRYVKQLDEILANIPEVERRNVVIENTYNFKIYIGLKEKRKRRTEEVVREIKQKFAQVVGVNAHAELDTDTADTGKFEFVIRGNKAVEQLSNYRQLIEWELMRSGLFEGRPQSIQHEKTDQYIIMINPMADYLRTDPRTIAEMVQTLIKGAKANMFTKDNRRYDVMVEVEDKNRQTPEDILKLYVKVHSTDRRKDDLKIPLGELVEVKPKMAYGNVVHHMRTRAYDQVYKLKSGVGVGQAVKVLNEAKGKILPEDIFVDFTGKTRSYLEEGNTMLWIFFLSVAFIYLVMAAQFESWRDPFIILCSLPLSLIGGVLAINLANNPVMTMYSFIGFITLIGLVSKHGIMMVDFANTLRDEGYSLRDAILRASQLRLRPILMTTLAMTLGVVPMLFESGPSAVSRFELGSVLVGGLMLGTFLTLFIIPCVYTLIAKRKPAVSQA